MNNKYNFNGKVAVVTGGSGVLCGPICTALASCGASVVIVANTRIQKAQQLADEIIGSDGRAIAIKADVLSRKELEKLASKSLDEFGRVDFLINGAGGAKKEATTSKDNQFFDLPEEAVRWVFDLNFMGTFLACQVFGKIMAEQDHGVILNFSSKGAFQPLTRSVAYSAGKAAVTNFTQWLAVHLSQEYSKNIRVNALVPGFFLTYQNRFLLTDETSGQLTERGKRIIEHTPAGRFGRPEDLVEPALWLLSDGALFVHGTVLMVDGGISAYGGI